METSVAAVIYPLISARSVLGVCSFLSPPPILLAKLISNSVTVLLLKCFRWIALFLDAF